MCDACIRKTTEPSSWGLRALLAKYPERSEPWMFAEDHRFRLKENLEKEVLKKD